MTVDKEDGPHATIRYEADLRDTDNAWLRLHYRANGEAVDYKVQLVTTKPNYGGHRWWFICPIVRRDGGSPRKGMGRHPTLLNLLQGCRSAPPPTRSHTRGQHTATGPMPALRF